MLCVLYEVTDSAVASSLVIVRENLHRLDWELSSGHKSLRTDHRSVELIHVREVDVLGDVVEVDHG